MRILLVAATREEISPFLSVFEDNIHTVKPLITGVGMVATAFSIGRHLATNSYDLAINAGIAGSFDRKIKIGEVINVVKDIFAELGAEDGINFLPINDLGFGESIIHPVIPNIKMPVLNRVNAITVNQVHGNENSIAQIIKRFNPQVESMEGAAFFYSCNEQGLPSVQFRAISNYVERRNKESWDIDLAIKNLNIELLSWIQSL